MKNLLEVIIKDEVQAALDSFCSCFDIRILFYSKEGDILKTGLDQPNALFCQLIQNKLYGRNKCVAITERKLIESAEQKKLLAYHCHAGLQEAIIPIFIEEHLAGFAMIGQFRTEKELPRLLKKDWMDRNNLSELQKAFNRVPYFPPEKIKHILDLFCILVNYIVLKNMVAIKGHLIIGKIILYINRNLAKKNISIGEIARHAGKSRSSVAHLLKKNLGISFKRLLIESKLDKAEVYFRTMPDMTVGEVSDKLGYDDQFYFSRIYRKYRNHPPSEYVKNSNAK